MTDVLRDWMDKRHIGEVQTDPIKITTRMVRCFPEGERYTFEVALEPEDTLLARLDVTLAEAKSAPQKTPTAPLEPETEPDVKPRRRKR